MLYSKKNNKKPADCVHNFNEGLAIDCPDDSNNYDEEALENQLYGNDFKTRIPGKECDSKDWISVITYIMEIEKILNQYSFSNVVKLIMKIKK